MYIPNLSLVRKKKRAHVVKFVKVKCGDGKSIRADVRCFRHCEVITAMMDASGGLTSFPLPGVASSELLLICEYGSEHASQPAPAPLPRPLPSSDLYECVPSHWDAAYIASLSLEAVLRLAAAALYVGCEPLCDLAAARIALETLRHAADPTTVAAALAAPAPAAAAASYAAVEAAVHALVAASAPAAATGGRGARAGPAPSSAASKPALAAFATSLGPSAAVPTLTVQASRSADLDADVLLTVAAVTGVAAPAAATGALAVRPAWLRTD